jgi:hypothetical protein
MMSEQSFDFNDFAIERSAWAVNNLAGLLGSEVFY